MRYSFLAIAVVLLTGLFHFTAAQTMPFRTYSIENGLSESVIHSMIQDERGFIWLGTGFGLNRFDGVQFRKWYEEDGLPNNRVNALRQTRDGKIWLGTDAGLAYLDNDSIYSPPSFEPVAESVVLSIYEDSDGSVWIATEGSGLWKYEMSGTFTNVSNEHGYRNMMARAVVQDANGVIWVGTSEGLFSYDGSSFKKYRHSDGIPEVPVNEMKVNSKGELWMATGAGLMVLSSDRTDIFDTAAGLNDGRLHSLSFKKEG